MYTLSLHDALPICFWCLSKGTFPRQAPSLDNVALMLPPLRNRFGVVVAGKESYAAYDGEGPLPGDVIYSVNGVPVDTVDSSRSVLQDLTTADAIALQVERLGSLHYLVLETER